MHKIKIFLLPLFISACFCFVSLSSLNYAIPLTSTESERLKYEEFLAQHPINTRLHNSENELERFDRPDLALELDFLRTMDLKLGRPTPERLKAAYDQVAEVAMAKGPVGLQWTERGPFNVGGRTRVVMFDPNDNTNKKVWAGGIGGGLWFTTDISISAPVWTKVNDLWENIGISTMAYDPSNKNIFYIGTGEGWGNVDAINGAGIWKTTNAGITWTRLTSTNNADFKTVQKIVVAPNGNVYASCSNKGIQRSKDGGTTWESVLGSSGFGADIEIASDGTIFASLGKIYTEGSIWKSISGDSGTWTKINNGGATGIPTTGIYRIELACAPSNANVLYAIVAGPNNGAALLNIYYSADKGATWTVCAKPDAADGGIPANDFTRGQAWYDLSMGVDPNNAGTLIVGGVDLFISNNNGAAWTQLSDWRGSSFPLVHADQHAVAFQPGSSTTVLFGNDGGVWQTANLTASPAVLRTFTSKNNGYNVTQFYACAMAGGSGVNYYLAGAQDNGSHKFASAGMNTTTEVTGGDGAFCFIDQDNQNFQITSYVYNSYYHSTNGGTSFGGFGSGSKGRFINPADLDSKENILYGCYDGSNIERFTGIGGTISAGTIAIPGMGSYASHLSVSPYAAAGKSNVFVGTESGRVFKVLNAQATATISEITGNLPVGTISCIDIGASEQELLVTFSNYGLNSVWYTNDGGLNWIDKEGNLPDMPVRWALFKPTDRRQVMVATEVGVWSTFDISVTTPNWIPSNSGMANTRVDMLQIRNSDYQVIAATHGRGLFSSMSFASNKVGAQFTSTESKGCPGLQIQFTDKSVNNPTSWQWSFPGGNPSSSTTQNTNVLYTSEGVYDVTLIAINSSSRDTVKLISYVDVKIPVAQKDLPLNENFKSNSMPTNWSIKNPDQDTTWRLNKNAGGYALDTASIVFPNSINSKRGGIDDLLLPNIELKETAQSFIKFDYAYMFSSSTFGDSLRLMYKTCSNDWQVIWEKGGKTLSTASLTSGYFIPKANQWKSDSVDITSLKNLGVIQFKFQNYSNSGKNIYLDNINVFQKIEVKPIANFESDKTTACAGDEIQYTDLSANNPNTWNWTFEGGNPSTSNIKNPLVTYSSQGAHTVELAVSNNAGADTMGLGDQIYIFNKPSIDFNSPDTVYLIAGTAEVNFENLSINATDFEWDFGNGDTSKAIHPTYSFTTFGTFTVWLKGINGICMDSLSKVIIVMQNVGFDYYGLEKAIVIYPNPSSKNILVNTGTNNTFDRLEISDVQGKLVFSTKEKSSKINVDVSNFSDGIYYVKMFFGEKSIVKKIIVN